MAYVVLEVLYTGGNRRLVRMPPSSVLWVIDGDATECQVKLEGGELWRVAGHASVVAEKLWGREE
jgi:hypothetical protein